MSEWKEYKLGELSELITKGTTPSTIGGAFVDKGINFIKSESLNYDGILDDSKFVFIDEKSNQLLKRSILKENDILYSIAGIYLGKIGVIKNNHLPANTNQACAIIRLKHKYVDYRFICHVFRDRSFIRFVNSLTGQAAQPNINLTDLGKLPIFLPSLPTQHRIASILSAYDELIENNNRRIALLEQMAEQINKEWFVRMRFPGYENTEFEKGVPKGWEITKVENAFKYQAGGTPSRDIDAYWKDGNIDWFTPTDITGSNGYFLDNSSEKCNEFGVSKSSAKLFPAYSIMMTSRATIGAIGINTKEACTNQGFITCIPNEKLPLTFLFYWLKLNKEYFISLSTGATFAELTKSAFKRVDIIIPDTEIVKKYDKKIKPIFNQLQTLQLQTQNLKQTRDLLLPRLISGKLRVKEAEKDMEKM